MMSVRETIQKAYDSGDFHVWIKNTASERSMLSRWATDNKVRYTSTVANGDILVLFVDVLVDRLLSE